MKKTIKEKVSIIVNTYKTRNPKDLAKKNSITVMYRDLGEIKGFFRDVLGKKFIAINENKLIPNIFPINSPSIIPKPSSVKSPSTIPEWNSIFVFAKAKMGIIR